jgi:hypothetical protein
MNNENIGIGDAPCGGCGLHVWEIKLLLNTQESDGNGGFWWRAVDGQQCAECAEPFIWFHKPAPIAIELPIAAVAVENNR